MSVKKAAAKGKDMAAYAPPISNLGAAPKASESFRSSKMKPEINVRPKESLKGKKLEIYDSPMTSTDLSEEKHTKKSTSKQKQAKKKNQAYAPPLISMESLSKHQKWIRATTISPQPLHRERWVKPLNQQMVVMWDP